MRTVLHIFRSPVGGLFRHVLDLSRAQAGAGLSVGMVFDAAPASGRLEAARAELDSFCRAGIVRLPIARYPAPGDLVNLGRLARRFRGERPDIIHGHGAKGGIYARLLSRLIGVPAVYTLHGGVLHFTGRTPSGALFLAAERAMLGITDGIIFDSRFARDEFAAKIGVPKCPTSIVGNGLHESEFGGAGAPRGAGEAADFVYLGELRLLKGVDVLLRAAALLRRGGRRFRLAVFGGGPDEAAFRKLAAELGLGDSVAFRGPVPGPREALAGGRCIVIPSRRESFPYIVLEAVAYGLPMIATDVGAIPEIFGPQRERLIPPDAPELLAQRMADFLDDDAAALAAAASLQDRIRRSYRVETMAGRIQEFYAEVVRGSGAPRRRGAPAGPVGQAGGRPPGRA